MGCLNILVEAGKKYGHLTAVKMEIRITKQAGLKKRYWWCLCDCGNQELVDRLEKGLVTKPNPHCGCQHPKYKSGKAHNKSFGDIPGEYWYSLERRAIERGLEWELTIEQGWQQFLDQNRKCALTGIELTFATRTQKVKGEEQTASYDRKWSETGYLLNNTWWIHKSLNIMKNDVPLDRFIHLCDLVTKTRNNPYQYHKLYAGYITFRRQPHWKGAGDISSSYWRQLELRAVARNLEWNITNEQGWDKFLEQGGRCALTGLPLQFATQKQRLKGLEQTASLDRIDSSKGYPNNFHWVDKDINKMKNNFTLSEFLSLCQQVHQYQQVLQMQKQAHILAA